jgi:branched-chain amino acid aminotransferase
MSRRIQLNSNRTIDLELNSNRIETGYTASSNLPFASIPTAHMFVVEGRGSWGFDGEIPHWDGEWTNPRIVPRKELGFMPNTDVFNYGSGVFEGGKDIQIGPDLHTWRYDMNAERLVRSGASIMLPCPSPEAQIDFTEALLDIDRLYFPLQENGTTIDGSSGYIRPLLIGIEEKLGVKAGSSAMYIVYLQKGGAYFDKPVTLWLQDESPRGPGMSKAKLGGNYAQHVKNKSIAGLYGAQEVLYLDTTFRYLRETGASNIFVDFDSQIIFPPFGDGVLDSNTTKTFSSLSTQLVSRGVHIQNQREISLEELIHGIASGEVTGMGAVGNAAAVSPVTNLVIKKDSNLYLMFLRTFRSMERDGRVTPGPFNTVNIQLGDGNPSPSTLEMKKLLTGMQTGIIPAPEGWLKKVPRRL